MALFGLVERLFSGQKMRLETGNFDGNKNSLVKFPPACVFGGKIMISLLSC